MKPLKSSGDKSAAVRVFALLLQLSERAPDRSIPQFWGKDGGTPRRQMARPFGNCARLVTDTNTDKGLFSKVD